MPKINFITYVEQQTYEWKLKDNKAIINNILAKKHGRPLKKTTVSEMIKMVMKECKVGELEACVILKKQLQGVIK